MSTGNIEFDFQMNLIVRFFDDRSRIFQCHAFELLPVDGENTVTRLEHTRPRHREHDEPISTSEGGCSPFRHTARLEVADDWRLHKYVGCERSALQGKSEIAHCFSICGSASRRRRR